MKQLYWKQYRVFIVLMAVGLCFVQNNIPARGQASTPLDALHSQHFLYQIHGNTPFVDPLMMATDSTGNLYVSDINLNIVQMFTVTGTYLRTFGIGAGTGNGQFNMPEGIAIVGNDVFIADLNNNRIQRFNKSTGAYISQFGTLGANPGQLNNPVQIAYNPINGLLYVAENGNARVQQFTTAGVSQGTFGNTQARPDLFTAPFGLAIDPLGHVYVSDSTANTVQRFTSAGVREFTVSSFGSDDDHVNFPQALAVDRAGFLYVADRGNRRIQKFNWQGNFVGKYGGMDTSDCGGQPKTACSGFFTILAGVAVSNVANTQPILYTADLGSGTVQAFEASLQPVSHPFEAKWGSQGKGAGQLNRPEGTAVDSSGNVYVAEYANDRLQKFDKYGRFIRQWGSTGTSNGQFNGPVGVAINNANNVFVVDSRNNRIQEFDSNGTFIRQWGSTGTGDGQFQTPVYVAVDNTYVYVTEAAGNRIQKFDFTGAFVRKWGASGTALGQLGCPAGIAVDLNRQFVYVAEGCNNRVQVFTVDGDPVSIFTNPSSLVGLTGLATDQRGNVYVIDAGHDRILQFNDNGQYIGTLGSSGSGDGQFVDPFGLAVDRNTGQIFVADKENGRMERFGSTNPSNDTVGVWRPSTRSFYLRNANTTGVADIIVDTSNFTLSTDQPVVGDWNGDGVSTVGVYRNGVFMLRDSNIAGSPDYTFALGVAGDVPIVGDWNADGKDGVGVFRPSNGLIFLKNDLTTGFADYQMVLGAPGDIGIGGDWNSDGQDSAGVRRPNSIQFFLADKVLNGSIFAEHSLQLGAGTDVPFAGDWVHQGTSGVGVFRPSNGLIFLKNSLTPGFADTQITLGIAGDVPVAGYWGVAPNGQPTLPPANAPTTQPTPRLAPTFVPSGK